jgi:ankyrin repeat protein
LWRSGGKMRKVHDNTSYFWVLIRDREIQSNIPDAMYEMIKEGIDLELQDIDDLGNTALHKAIRRNDLKCVEFILKFNPNVCIRNNVKLTPKEYSEKFGGREQLTNMIEDKEKLNKCETSPIMITLKSEYTKFVQNVLKLMKIY